ncbi:hypothetical protein Ciccas_009120, partial [Cichlidogyrus casuarinus]
ETTRKYEIVFRSLEDTEEQFSNVVAIIEEIEKENKDEKARKRCDFLYKKELTFGINEDETFAAMFTGCLTDQREKVDQRKVQIMEGTCKPVRHRKKATRRATVNVVRALTERNFFYVEREENIQSSG